MNIASMLMERIEKTASMRLCGRWKFGNKPTCNGSGWSTRKCESPPYELTAPPAGLVKELASRFTEVVTIWNIINNIQRRTVFNSRINYDVQMPDIYNRLYKLGLVQDKRLLVIVKRQVRVIIRELICILWFTVGAHFLLSDVHEF